MTVPCFSLLFTSFISKITFWYYTEMQSLKWRMPWFLFLPVSLLRHFYLLKQICTVCFFKSWGGLISKNAQLLLSGTKCSNEVPGKQTLLQQKRWSTIILSMLTSSLFSFQHCIRQLVLLIETKSTLGSVQTNISRSVCVCVFCLQLPILFRAIGFVKNNSITLSLS